MQSWFKFYRSIVESSVFEDAEVLKVWIWLLCNVAYEEHDVVFYGKIVHVNVGDLPTGRKKIAQKINMSESKVYRALNILKGLGNITIKSNNKYSIITVVNWEKYQSASQSFNIKITAGQQQGNGKTTGKKPQKEHNNRNKEYKEIKEYNSALSGNENGEEQKLNEAGLPIIDFGLSKKGYDF